MGVDRLVMHIGTHKAGSTALQLFMERNRDAFAAQGIALPRAGADPEWGHHSNVAWQFLRPDLFDPARGTLRDLVAELAACTGGTALVSSEEFELLPGRDAVSAFLAPLRQVARRIDLLLYVRPQFLYAASAYSEALKAGNIGDFDPFFAQAITWARLDYDSHFAGWEGHPGTALCVRPMTRALRRRGIGIDLLKVLGIAGRPGFEPEARHNLGLGAEAVHALLYARSRAHGRGPALTRPICTAIREMVAEIAPDPRPFSALTRGQVRRCEDLHKRGNAAFTTRHGLPAWDQLFETEIATAGTSPETAVPADLQRRIEAGVDRLLADPGLRRSA